MLSKVLTVLALGASSLAININGPNPNAYWVQNISNVINWSFSDNDPNPIDITITNPNDTTLNGAFFIQNNVDLTNGTFTVTNVTLKVGSGYVVNFVNSTNHTQVFASSQAFDVKKPGTPKSTDAAAQPPAAGNNTSGSNGGNSSDTGNGTHKPLSSAPKGVNVPLPIFAATGLVTLAGLVSIF